MKLIFIFLWLVSSSALLLANGAQEEAPADIVDIRQYLIGEWDLEVIDGNSPEGVRSVRWSFLPSDEPHSSFLRGNSSDPSSSSSQTPLLLDFPGVIFGSDGKPLPSSNSHTGALYASSSSASLLLLPHLRSDAGRAREWLHVLSFRLSLSVGKTYYSSGAYGRSGCSDVSYQLMVTNPNAFILNLVEARGPSAPPQLHLVTARRVNPVSTEPSFVEQYSFQLTAVMIFIFHFWRNGKAKPPQPATATGTTTTAASTSTRSQR